LAQVIRQQPVSESHLGRVHRSERNCADERQRNDSPAPVRGSAHAAARRPGDATRNRRAVPSPPNAPHAGRVRGLLRLPRRHAASLGARQSAADGIGEQIVEAGGAHRLGKAAGVGGFDKRARRSLNRGCADGQVGDAIVNDEPVHGGVDLFVVRDISADPDRDSALVFDFEVGQVQFRFAPGDQADMSPALGKAAPDRERNRRFGAGRRRAKGRRRALSDVLSAGPRRRSSVRPSRRRRSALRTRRSRGR